MRFHLHLDPSRVPDDIVTCRRPDTPLRLQLGGRAAVSPRTALPVLQSAVGDTARAARSDAWFSLPVDELGHLLVVPAGATVHGDVRAHAVWVAGEVAGRVTATGGVLVVDAGGCVRGGLDGQGPVVVAGRVRTGPGRAAIVARGRLDLACTAHVVGEVFHDVVALYEGARLDGGLRAVRRRR